jgi:hypothetical protein
MGYKVSWQAVLERYDYRCYYCGVQSLKLIREHKIPYARGGRTSRDNLVPACMSCNVRKGTSTAEEFVAVLDMQERAKRWQEPPLTYEELVDRDGEPSAASSPADDADGPNGEGDEGTCYVAHSSLVAYVAKFVLTSVRISPQAKLLYGLWTMGFHPLDRSIDDGEADVLTTDQMCKVLWCDRREYARYRQELLDCHLAEPMDNGYVPVRPGYFQEDERRSP